MFTSMTEGVFLKFPEILIPVKQFLYSVRLGVFVLRKRAFGNSKGTIVYS